MKKHLIILFLLLLPLIILSAVDQKTPSSCSKKKAIIFGITGQDGAYLTEFLLDKGYEVHGVIRRNSPNVSRLDQLLSDNNLLTDQLFIHYGDLTDSASIFTIIQEVKPDEIYNLAAQSMVRDSFDIPEITADVNAIGALRILETIRLLGIEDKTKYYQASTSELYGVAHESPQSENTPFSPRSPYAISKMFAYWITINYRETYHIFACNGILFNHESPLRGEKFVTRKITQAAAKIKLGQQDVLYLGNLDAKRDWGYAKDYVEAMWHILQLDTPQDFVIATGEKHSVREFVEIAFKHLGMEIEWEGKGVDEIGIDKHTKRIVIKIDPKYFRPIEPDLLIGNAQKAKQLLNWEPKTKFEDLIKLMVDADYDKLFINKI